MRNVEMPINANPMGVFPVVAGRSLGGGNPL